jgi:hypothetical protein
MVAVPILVSVDKRISIELLRDAVPTACAPGGRSIVQAMAGFVY